MPVYLAFLGSFRRFSVHGSIARGGTSSKYRIVDLRPGIYSVTFTLTGFNTFRRDVVQLPAEFTATINAELKVGALEETVTVTGESPIVDVSTAVHTQILDRETIDAIPTGRTIQGMGQPGIALVCHGVPQHLTLGATSSIP